MARKVSVLVPTKGGRYLEYVLRGLKTQSVRPYEVVLVLKDCDVKSVEEMCTHFSLRCLVFEQKDGGFTRALNMCKKAASGDLLIFTDDDAIPPKKWLEKYLMLHQKYSDVAGISSRDIHVDIIKSRILPTDDDKLTVRLYRWLIRPWRELPHPLLRKCRFGVYLTWKFKIAHGPYIPYKTCYSLPFRGVNMSFKSEFIENIWFPEHPKLLRAPGNEQYLGLQLILKGYETIYVPDNPVLHIIHESLSKTRYKEVKREFRREMEVMSTLYMKLIQRSFSSKSD